MMKEVNPNHTPVFVICPSFVPSPGGAQRGITGGGSKRPRCHAPSRLGWGLISDILPARACADERRDHNKKFGQNGVVFAACGFWHIAYFCLPTLFLVRILLLLRDLLAQLMSFLECRREPVLELRRFVYGNLR